MNTLRDYESLAKGQVNTKNDDCLAEDIAVCDCNLASPGFDNQQIRCCTESCEFRLLFSLQEPAPALLVHAWMNAVSVR